MDYHAPSLTIHLALLFGLFLRRRFLLLICFLFVILFLSLDLPLYCFFICCLFLGCLFPCCLACFSSPSALFSFPCSFLSSAFCPFRFSPFVALAFSTCSSFGLASGVRPLQNPSPRCTLATFHAPHLTPQCWRNDMLPPFSCAAVVE